MIKTKRTFSFALVAMLICCSSAYSQTILSAPTQTIGIGPSESFLIFADSFAPETTVDSLDIFVDIPPALNPGGVPTVVNITGQGIFSGGSAVFTPATPSSSAQGSFSIPVSTAPTVQAPIAEIFFDTTGFSVGDQILFGLFDNTNGSTFSDAGEPLETAIQLTFTADIAVPEPSSAGLLFALGCIGMIRRKRA